MQKQLVTGQFNDSFAPIMDGVGVAVQNYALWLHRLLGPAYVVTPATPDHTDDYEFTVLRYFSVPAPMVHPYRMGLHHLDYEFWQAMRSVRFDLVHAHCPFTSGRLARRIARSQGIPLVATFHTKYKDNLERFTSSKQLVKSYLAFITEFYNSADQVWVPNNATGDTLREYGYRGASEVVPNGSDMETWGNERDVLRRMAESELGLTRDETALLFVGQHVWEKNLAFLIQALDLAHKAGARFRMFFVGQGYAATEMQAMVEQAGLGNVVQFLGLIHDRQRLQRIYARADLLLFPSLYDNAPLTVREAAAACLPALLIHGCNAAEGIVDGYNGFLAESSPQEYARVVCALLADPGLRHNAGLKAHGTLFRTWESIASEVAVRYAELEQRYVRPRTHSIPWLSGHRNAPGAPSRQWPQPPLSSSRKKSQPWL